jgi:hypothetical protein
MDATQLQEAPASVTYSITSPDGFNALFTVREMSGTELLGKMSGTIEKKLLELGYKPQAPKMGYPPKVKDYVEGRVCPVDGGKLVNKVSKAGKKYIQCENGSYNPVTKTTDGCKYTEWL